MLRKTSKNEDNWKLKDIINNWLLYIKYDIYIKEFFVGEPTKARKESEINGKQFSTICYRTNK